MLCCAISGLTCKIRMNGAWVKPEWEAASVALQALEKTSQSSSTLDTKSPVKSTSAVGVATTAAPNPMSYDPSYYSQYYAAYSYPYPPYGMYGYGPSASYGPYGYHMPFAGPTPQQMQPPPPPPPAKSEPKLEPKSDSSSEQSSANSSVATAVSTDASSISSTSATDAGIETSMSTASVTQCRSTWPEASSADSTSPDYIFPGSPWQSSSTAGMLPRCLSTPSRPKSFGATGFQNEQTLASGGNSSWQQYSFPAGSPQQTRPTARPAMSSLRWSNVPRGNPYDGLFRQSIPSQSSEPYCPFDPTESEECEGKPADGEHRQGFCPVPDAANFRFRMPNRGASRPMQWRQQSPRAWFGADMQSSQRGPMQRSPNWRPGQYPGPQRAPRPDQGNAGARPIIMPRLKNCTPRPRVPFSTGPDSQRMHSPMVRPTKMQQSRWDDTGSGKVESSKSSTGPTADTEALSAASAEEWPTSLKDFVHRCFSSVNDNRSKDKMEAQLKDVLTAAFSDGTAMTRDWDHEPVPIIPNSTSAFLPLNSPPVSDGYGRPSSNRGSPRSFKFAGSLRGRRGAASSGSRRGRAWSPPGFQRRSRSRSRSRKSRSRSSSRSSSSSRRSRRRRHRRRRDSRYF